MINIHHQQPPSVGRICCKKENLGNPQGVGPKNNSSEVEEQNFFREAFDFLGPEIARGFGESPTSVFNRNKVQGDHDLPVR